MLTRLSISLLLLLMFPPRTKAQSVPFTPPTPAELRAAATPSSDPTWWKHAVIYEIYPAQLPGHQRRRHRRPQRHHQPPRLPRVPRRRRYLARPHVPLAQVDFGYDISNYTAIDPHYGTLADFDRLIAAAKTAPHPHPARHGAQPHLRQAPLVRRSASSRTNPHADWYIWNDGIPPSGRTTKPGLNEHHGPKGWVVPPNNWSSLFQRLRVGVGPRPRPVLLPLLLQAAARPQLAQSRGRKSHVRRHAFLA